MSKGRLISLLVACLVVVSALWGTILALGYEPVLGLDLQGGVAITLIPAPGQGSVDVEVLDQTVSIIRSRVDALGVAEPEIARQGETVVVQLPGVADRDQAVEVVGQTAQLQFRPVVAILAETETAAAEVSCEETAGTVPPADQEVVLCERTFDPTVPPPADPVELPPDQRIRVRLGPAALAGTDVTDARASLDPQTGLQWLVNLELSDEGAAAFEQITGDLACNPAGSPQRGLAIVLDGIVESRPGIADTVICDDGIGDGKAVITTGGGETEAKQLALVLRTGALPIDLDIATVQSVSPTLGRSSLDAGLLAGAIGLVLVTLYLVLLYRGIGLAAAVELVFFGFMMVGIITLMGNTVGFTLTLAGIAGVIVAIGIAADSSIIYRERFRDEIRAGRTVRTAADYAFSKALRTNVTGNFVTFLAAAVLYLLAVGPVRGFAFTLGLATVIDTLTYLTFTRGLFGLIARSPKLAANKLIGLRAGVHTPGASA